ncbi:MAG: hypothetical protein ACSHX5_03550 [Phycisphaerales bacterium]
MILTQTTALFVDAYRELNAKKLFWLTIGLSVLVAVAFSMVTIHESGINIFWFSFENQLLNSKFFKPSEFYVILFVGLAIPYWLAWPAVILALVSTAGLIPDFVSNESIQSQLCKPISRSRLFLTKYATGLMFVALQVTIFAVGWFIIIGVRGGEWKPSIFLSIPIVTLFYSYLFSMCALIGLVTRSTITALLLTLIIWLGLWAGNWADVYFLGQREGAILQVEDLQKSIERAKNSDNPNQSRIDQLEVSLVESEQKMKSARFTFMIVSAVRTVVPKTSETTNLLGRYLITIEKEDEIGQAQLDQMNNQSEEIPSWLQLADPRVATRIDEARSERSVFWIIGTSLLFEVVVLGLACIIFVRRDF